MHKIVYRIITLASEINYLLFEILRIVLSLIIKKIYFKIYEIKLQSSASALKF